METHIKWNFILVSEFANSLAKWFSFKENGCCHGISLIFVGCMGFEENFSFHVTIRRMTVPFFVSCNASLAKTGYMMSMHEEAIVDPELAKAEADNVEDDEHFRKKLWLMVAKHVEQEKETKRENNRKGIAFFKETDELLKIEDILPFFRTCGGDWGSQGSASGGNCMKGREVLGLVGVLGGGRVGSCSGGQQGMLSVNCCGGKSRREEEEGR
ncbi:hypothetical protein CsSME_00048384 [Camellia sinensis var. sinensis]